MSHRDRALANLESIQKSLINKRPLRIDAKAYLLEVCRLGLLRDGRGNPQPHHDPLGLARLDGDRSDDARQLAMAHDIHMLLKTGVAKKVAYIDIGERYGVGASAASKAYLARVAELSACDAIYAARESESKAPRSAHDAVKATHAKNAKRNRRAD